MSLRIDISCEMKETLIEEGCYQEDITKEIYDLIDEEIQRMGRLEREVPGDEKIFF